MQDWASIVAFALAHRQALLGAALAAGVWWALARLLSPPRSEAPTEEHQQRPTPAAARTGWGWRAGLWLVLVALVIVVLWRPLTAWWQSGAVLPWHPVRPMPEPAMGARGISMAPHADWEARALYDRGRFLLAAKRFSQFVDAEPRNAWARSSLAWALWRAGKARAANEELSRACQAGDAAACALAKQTCAAGEPGACGDLRRWPPEPPMPPATTRLLQIHCAMPLPRQAVLWVSWPKMRGWHQARLVRQMARVPLPRRPVTLTAFIDLDGNRHWSPGEPWFHGRIDPKRVRLLQMIAPITAQRQNDASGIALHWPHMPAAFRYDYTLLRIGNDGAYRGVLAQGSVHQPSLQLTVPPHRAGEQVLLVVIARDRTDAPIAALVDRNGWGMRL